MNISEKYIDKNIVIDRSSLVRSYNSFKGNAAFARAIKYINNPTEDMMIKAVDNG